MAKKTQDKSVQFTPNPDQSKVKHLRITVDDIRVAPSGHVRIEAISGNVGFGVRLPYMPPVPFEVGEILFIEYPKVEGKPSFSQPFTAIYRESEKPQERNMNLPANISTPITMTSREIAALTEKPHSNVMRDIRNMIEQITMNSDLNPCAKSITYTGKDGRKYQQYELDKDTCITLLLGYNPTARMRVVKRWGELEQQIAEPAFVLPDFTDPVASARAWASEVEQKREAEKREQIAQQERDEAIRTKAQIGSRREASAMAKASAASRKVKRLEEQLGFCAKHATVKAVEAKTKTKIGWRKLKSWCVANNVTPIAVADQNYGEVKAWPADAWKAAYGIDLPALFITETA